MGKPRCTFTREFKVQAVKLVTEQRRSFAEGAANLGIAENQRLQMERDILNKATAFFAKESQGGTASWTNTAARGRLVDERADAQPAGGRCLGDGGVATLAGRGTGDALGSR